MQYGVVEGWLTDSGAKIDRVLAPSGKARLKSFLPADLVPRSPGPLDSAFSLDKYILRQFPRLDQSIIPIIGLFLSLLLLYILHAHSFVIVRHPRL